MGETREVMTAGQGDQVCPRNKTSITTKYTSLQLVKWAPLVPDKILFIRCKMVHEILQWRRRREEKVLLPGSECKNI